MMKYFLTLSILLAANILIAQNYSGNISDFKLDALAVAVFPFGMDYPLKIGNVDKEGHVQLNLDAVDLNKIPDNSKSSFQGRVTDNFFVKCDHPDSLKISNEIKAINCEIPYLWQNNQMSGALYLVSDKALQPWIQDRYYAEPVNASFFQILYVDNDVDIHKRCATTYNLESGNVEAINDFNLKLKKGFNLLEYKIDSIHKTNPNETSSIPVKMQILTPENGTDIKWIVNYF